VSFSVTRTTRCPVARSAQEVAHKIKDPDSSRAKRAMEAMMDMVKIDISAVERAADRIASR